jgi:hypothetical protein
MTKFTVIQNTTKSQRELAGEMCERIKELVYEYSELVPAALAIGVLEIAKSEILRDQE